MGRIYQRARNTLIFLEDGSREETVLKELVDISGNVTRGILPRYKEEALKTLYKHTGSEVMQTVRENTTKQILTAPWSIECGLLKN